MVFTLLYFVMRAMSLVSLLDKPQAAPEIAPPAAAPVPALPQTVTPEIVAAITAALVADIGDDNFCITSITPVAVVGAGTNSNSAWAQAGREKQMQGLQGR